MMNLGLVLVCKKIQVVMSVVMLDIISDVFLAEGGGLLKNSLYAGSQR